MQKFRDASPWDIWFNEIYDSDYSEMGYLRLGPPSIHAEMICYLSGFFARESLVGRRMVVGELVLHGAGATRVATGSIIVMTVVVVTTGGWGRCLTSSAL